MRHRFACLALLVALAAPAGAQNPDFDGNGTTDILWNQVAGTSSLEAWLMTGLNRTSVLPVNPPAPDNPNWKVGCVADFNADDKPDILWRNADSGKIVVWKMNTLPAPEYMKEAGFFIEPLPADAGMLSDLNWRLVACNDMGTLGSGAPDAKTDIVWQNDATGQIYIWFLVAFTHMDSSFVDTTPGPGWKVLAVRDFGTMTSMGATNDRPDFLFQNVTSKKTVIWFMDGAAKVDGIFTFPDGPADLNWEVTGAGDFGTSSTDPLLDTHNDIAFRNTTSGRVVVWFMDGWKRKSTPGNGGFVTPDQTLSWTLIAPR